MYAKTKKETNPFLIEIVALQAAQNYEVWPENHEVFLLFMQMQTQWRTGASGPSGLDYNTLFTFMSLMSIAPAKQIELLDDIRVMEATALTEIHREKD